MTLYARFAAHLDAALDALDAEGAAAGRASTARAVAVEPPRDPSHGDLATNAAMVLAKRAGTNPRALAGLIAPKLEALPRSRRRRSPGRASSTCGSTPDVWQEELRAILAEGGDYGRSDDGRGASGSMSNMSRPTRPGRCIWAIAAAPWSATRWRACSNMPATRVTREYYVNDAGGQVDVLARSAHLRYREALGEDDRRDPGRASIPATI